MPTDFEAEGLLDGVEGKARQGRLELLEKLEADGVPVAELRRAIAEERLALIPVEQVLAGEGPRYTRHEMAEMAGVDAGFLARQSRALGMPEPDPDEKAFTQRDIDAAKRVKALLDLDIPEEEMLQVSRVIGMNMSQLAAASRGLGIRVFSNPDDTELEVGTRFATVIEGLAPLLTPSLEYVLQLHMREQIRHDVFGRGVVSEGVESGIERSFAFADMVGFTKLGERLDPAEIGDLSDKLGELASQVIGGPIRLVKLIGDAVMLMSSDPKQLLDAVLELVALAEREGEGFPLLRAGIAHGRAVARGGDYYGRPVNLASRITGVARPDSVLCDEKFQEEAGEDAYEWSFAGGRHLKGIDGEVKLFRARPKRADASP